MNALHSFNRLAALLLAALLAPHALADDGHNHGEAPPAAAGSAWPRFAASTDLFELVGVLEGQRLRLYLDRSNDNSPVKDARLELELGGTKLKVEPHGEGEFEALLERVPEEGALAVTATVMAGNESDLLAAELDIHHDEHTAAAGAALDWKKPAGWAAAAIAVVAALTFALRRTQARRAGGAA